MPFELVDVDVFGRIADGNSNYVLQDSDHRRLPVLEDGEERISGGWAKHWDFDKIEGMVLL